MLFGGRYMSRAGSRPFRAAFVRVLPSLVVLFALFCVFVSVSTGQGQVNVWTEPDNLSQSGSGSEPHLFVDSAGVMRVIWQDAVVNSFVFTMLQEGAWSVPIAVELPFGTRVYSPDLQADDPTPLFTPILATSGAGVVHALWLDDEDILFHSSVPNADFGTFAAWLTPTRLGESVVSAALASLPDNQVAAAYIQSTDLVDAPAGVYFRQSADNGATWSAPAPLHLSSYYRLLTPDTANVQLAVDSQNRIYVAWDDWANERILLVHSADGGQTWSTLFEIDKRQEEDELEVVGPARVQLATVNDTVHVVWQAGHEEDICNQYYSWSGDGGNTWQSRQQFLGELFGCPTQVHLMSDQGDLLVLAEESGARYLTYRTENGWTEEEVQPPLSGFQNPDTFQEIAFTCGQDADLHGGFIWITSCGEAVSQDVWLQQRSMSEFISSLSVVTLWQPWTHTETTNGFSFPQSVPDEAGRIHMLWGGPVPAGGSVTELETAPLSYSRWDEGRWSRMTDGPSIADSPNHHVAVTEDGAGFLLAVWQGGERGSIYFSRASTNDAVFSSEWREPQPLTDIMMPAGVPDIAVDSAGTIYVVYTVPINEDRGVYLLKSLDGGENWSEPIVAFDGVAAGGELIEEARLTISSQDTLHIVWINSSPSSVGVGDKLYYSQSQDGGETWTDAQQVVSGSNQSIHVQGHLVEATTQDVVHRVWQEWNLGHLSFLHQVSVDDGLTWQPLVQVSTVVESEVPATLASDPVGQLHLLFPRFREGTSEGIGPYSIEYYLWNGVGWRQMEGVEMRTTGVVAIESLTAAVSGDELVLVVGGVTEADPQTNLLYTQRPVELPAELPEPEGLVTATPVPAASPTITPTPQPSPTPTVALADIPNQSQPPIVRQLGQFWGIAIGLVVAVGILVPVFLLFRLRQVWARNKS